VCCTTSPMQNSSSSLLRSCRAACLGTDAAGAPPRLGKGHPSSAPRRSDPPLTELAPLSPKGKGAGVPPTSKIKAVEVPPWVGLSRSRMAAHSWLRVSPSSEAPQAISPRAAINFPSDNARARARANVIDHLST
jgi:hypothetical protein